MHTFKTESGRAVTLVNPSDASWTKHKYVLWVGQISARYLVIWANSLESALEEMCDWVIENAPGLLCDESMKEEYDRAISEGESEETAMERAEMDVTVFGHNGYHGILSDEWGIAFENPTRTQMLDLLERTK